MKKILVLLFLGIALCGCKKEEFNAKEYDFSRGEIQSYENEPEELRNCCQFSPVGRNDGLGGTYIALDNQDKKLTMILQRAVVEKDTLVRTSILNELLRESYQCDTTIYLRFNAEVCLDGVFYVDVSKDDKTWYNIYKKTLDGKNSQKIDLRYIIKNNKIRIYFFSGFSTRAHLKNWDIRVSY